MPIPSDAHVERIPLDGRDLEQAVKQKCTQQANRDNPRSLLAATTVNTQNGQEVILLFDLVRSEENSDATG